MSYIMGDVEVKINVTLLNYVCSNSIQDVNKPNLFGLWFGFYFVKKDQVFGICKCVSSQRLATLFCLRLHLKFL